MRLTVLVAILVTTLAPLRASAQFTPFEVALARFDAEVAAGVAEDAGGAVSLAVFSGSEVIWAKGYGWANIEERVAADARTIGRTSSISKSNNLTHGRLLLFVPCWFKYSSPLGGGAAEVVNLRHRSLGRGG